MKKEILFTTALFDINRTNWKLYNRSNNSYIEFFKTWAGIDNQLVAYCNSKEIADEVLRIRTDLGRKEKTKVIVVNPFELYPDLYKRTQEVTDNKIQQAFHVRRDSPESKNAKYVYIMFLKAWCLDNSAKLFPNFETSCWIDFGFGKGNEIFTTPKDFNFTYTTEELDSIYFQPLKPINYEIPIFDLVRTGDTFTCGAFYLGPNKYWSLFLSETKKYYESLLNCGLVDDDQLLQLMFILQHSDKAKLLSGCNYYDGFCSLSGQSFNFVKSEKQQSKYSKLVYKINSIRQTISYSFRTFNYLIKQNTKQ